MKTTKPGMEPRRLLIVFAALVISPLFFISCSRCTVGDVRIGEPGGGEPRTITIMSYNVENLFDDADNGTEYREFDPGEGEWTTDHFYAKMLALAEVIESVCPERPDILALQEVENLDTLETFRDDVLKNGGYRYAALVEAPEAAVNTGVLSSFPLTDVRSHLLHGESTERLRSILEVEIDAGGTKLFLFNNHWKSKAGGAEETEYLRIESAELLAGRIMSILAEDPSAEIVVCGDLNENHDEYARIGKAYPTALLPAGEGAAGADPAAPICLTGDPEKMQNVMNGGGSESESLVLYSPWFKSEARGSYVYRNSWETIDHFLLGPGLFDEEGITYAGFSVGKKPFMLDEEGHPLRWYTETRSGYSDHLPLLLDLEIE